MPSYRPLLTVKATGKTYCIDEETQEIVVAKFEKPKISEIPEEVVKALVKIAAMNLEKTKNYEVNNN